VRLGLMGGTFDPIHCGHLAAAEEVRNCFMLDRMIFIPSARPPHKTGKVITDHEHRYTMAVLATVSNPYFDVSRIEIDRPGPSYTVDTLRHFRQVDTSAELFFITGADAILEILGWREPRDLLRLCRFVAVSRPGYDLDDISCLEAELGAELVSNIEILPVTPFDISSSDIRQRVAEGRSIRYLVPEEVRRYIYRNGLYR